MKGVPVVRVFAALGLLLAFLFTLPVTRADEWNQATEITFSQPFQIPGQVLPAGTYLFEVIPNFNHEIVRISDSTRTKVFALVQALPIKDQRVFGKAAVTIAQRAGAQPEAIVAWFYPGRTQGHQFLYPEPVQRELAKDKQETVVSGD